MTDEASHIINEIVQLREQYFAEVGADARRAWPKSIRDRVMALDAMKVNRKELAQATGVPYETLMQWRHKRKNLAKGFHALALKPANATVTVAPQNESPAVNATVTVTTPNGYRVEGLVQDVLKVLKGLRKCS